MMTDNGEFYKRLYEKEQRARKKAAEQVRETQEARFPTSASAGN